MDYLTVKQYSELANISVRYTQKLIQNGKIKAEKQFNQEIKQTCYMITVSSLPEDLQLKYYDNLKSEMNLPGLKEEKTAIKQCKNAISKTFEELSEEERKEANMWTDIIKEWLGIRGRYKNKAQADENFVGKCRWITK